jgi:hypothetical protein
VAQLGQHLLELQLVLGLETVALGLHEAVAVGELALQEGQLLLLH